MLKPSLDDLLKSSFRSVLKNKSRTLLTTLGVIIGVTSVILLTSIGNGLKIYINEQFETLGSNSVYISPGKIFGDSGGFNRSGANASTIITASFTQKDLNNLKKNLKTDLVMPMKNTSAEIKAGETKKTAPIKSI